MMGSVEDGLANQTPLKTYLAKKAALRAVLIKRLKDPPSEVAADVLSEFPNVNFFPQLLSALTTILKSASPFDALHLVDVATQLSQKGTLDNHAPVTILHYIFTFATLDDLVANLGAIRQRISAIPPTRLLQLYFIKLFQSAIERDAHGLNPIRSGRLRITLATSLRAWHPSSMNRRGTYSIHPIPYDPLPEENVDAALYNSLWGLQKFLQNPSLVETLGPWREFATALDTVLSAFETTPVSSDTPPHGVDYPTSPSVLSLQLGDNHFRLHMLVQYAILLHHLETTASLPVTSKDSQSARQNAEFCAKLFSSGGEGEALKIRVFGLLEKDDSGRLKRLIQGVLQRERVWIRWKKRSHYSHLKTGPVGSPTAFKRRTVLWHQKDKPSGINSWLTRINSLEVQFPDGNIYAPLSERSPIPGVKELKEALEEDRNDQTLEQEFKRKNDKKFRWRALRTLMDDDVFTLSKLSKSSTLDLDEMLDEKDINTKETKDG